MLQPILIIIALSASYVWVSVPELRDISLQLTGLLLVFYFVSKRFTANRLHHILPKPESFETALLTTAVAVIIGSTGSLESPFLPLFHLILFISVLTISLEANIIKMIGLTIFLWSTSVHPLTRSMWIELMSLPFLMPLMIFARLEFEEAREERHLHELEDDLLKQQESRMLLFLGTYVKPKLAYIRQLLQLQENTWTASKQLELLEQEVTQAMQEIDTATDTLDEPTATTETA
ncbi:hypothetical protein LRY65_02595 [Candidatus Woesebacteria bacterium]|nr:hypothetical protein [Candidatus Woesebacteria bacterium]MCD8507058.1 hypothetical protein [Candidatus Woesebacteria bacterium]MCD8527083.1 hypothetical protein [Candidatus Woesebacteria bacterium]MCD8546712.1 hypothetical protein [Candidatus Woesebacteria bacterium]